jgi:hypothetical protein
MNIIKEFLMRLFAGRDNKFALAVLYAVLLFLLGGIGIYIAYIGGVGKAPYISQEPPSMGDRTRMFLILFGGGLFGLAVVLGTAIYWAYNDIYKSRFSFPGLRNFLVKPFRSDQESKADKATNAARIKAVVQRIRNLQATNDFTFVLAGSTYLDVKLDSVPTTELEENEFGNMGPLEFNIGGSAYWVGYYLWKLHQIKSHLFTACSTMNDPLSIWYQRLISKDFGQWAIPHFEVSETEATGVTVILVQRGDAFNTMFTSPGVLKQFCFTNIQDELYQTLALGGILYISGYFKTALSKDIKRFLRGIKNREKVLVCIDHGRLIAGQGAGDAVLKLQEVIKLDLVDIYICTFQEFWSLYHYTAGQPIPLPRNTTELKRSLRDISLTHMLPPITIIRDVSMPDGKLAYVHLSNQVEWKPINLPTPIGSSKSLGAHNSFNAEFLYQLVNPNHTKKDLDNMIKESVTRALEVWNKWNKRA